MEPFRSLLASGRVYLDRADKRIVFALGVALLAIVGFLDYITGPEISFAIFYLLPVSLLTWLVGRGAGVAVSFASASIWLWADLVENRTLYSYQVIPFWNATVRLGFFLIVAHALWSLRRALNHARIDYLTGIPNSRAFHDAAEAELKRSHRYRRPVTMAYLDVDDFKGINDSFGHHTGDLLLQTVASSLHNAVRATDHVCRLGGDEFALLLPDVGAEVAREAAGRIQAELIEAVRQRHWPVSFSIGVVTFVQPPSSVDVMMREADQIMYEAKAARAGVQYLVVGAWEFEREREVLMGVRA